MNQHGEPDIAFRNKVEACWRVLSPLVEKASRILEHWGQYRRQTDRLNELRGRAGATVRGYHKPPGEPHWALKVKELGDRAAPPRPQEVLHLFEHLRAVLPESTVDQLEQQMDFTSVKKTCSLIVQAQEELRRSAGPPPADGPAPTSEATPLIDKRELDLAEAAVREAEEQLREIDRAEQERSAAEQQRARAEQRLSPPAPSTVNAQARRLLKQGKSDEEIKAAVRPLMRSENPHASDKSLDKRFRNSVQRALRRERGEKKVPHTRRQR